MSGLLLVTGGSGFIGSAVVAEALAAGWRVRVLDSLRADVHGPEQAPVAGVEFVRADVCDAGAVHDALDGADAVCHQAAKVGLGIGIGDAPDYVSSNSLGTAVLLAAMAGAGVARLVLASSMVVYGEGLYRDGDRVLQAPARTRADLEAGVFEPVSPRTGERLAPVPIGEDAPCDPRSVYAATKLEQELLARTWAQGGGRVALLRYHNVYGPGMPQGTPYAGVASLFRSALERGEALLGGDLVGVDPVTTAGEHEHGRPGGVEEQAVGDRPDLAAERLRGELGRVDRRGQDDDPPGPAGLGHRRAEGGDRRVLGAAPGARGTVGGPR